MGQPANSARLPVGELALFQGNPRRGIVDEIARSLEVSGQYKPIVVNRGTETGRPNEVLAGNHTLLAARKLGWSEVDVWLVDVDDQQARRIVAVDNRLADKGGYDEDDLFALLDGLDDLDGTGYDDADLEQMRRDLYPDEPLTDPDDVPDAPVDPISAVGQVWELGPHRLLVGDSTDVALVDRALFDGVRADCVWTDPPSGLIVRQNLVWVKNTLVLGRSDYHYQHEPILTAEAPDDEDSGPEHEPVLYGFTSGGKGRLGRGGARWFGDNKQATVFHYKKPARNGQHPTMKPVGLIAAMLANSCPLGGVVFDPFSGSGSTLIAAHGRGARAFCVELDPRYADVIIRRYQEHTGVVPIVSGREVSFVGGS